MNYNLKINRLLMIKFMLKQTIKLWILLSHRNLKNKNKMRSKINCREIKYWRLNKIAKYCKIIFKIVITIRINI